MPKLTSSLPKYRKHRASGQAIVTIGRKDFYLGPHGTKASKREYDRIVLCKMDGRPSLDRFEAHCNREMSGERTKP